MSFASTNGRKHLVKIGGGVGNAPTMWSYKTSDTLATVDGAGYFNDAGDVLKLGDWIFTTVVTNLDASNEAFSAAGIAVVNSRSLSAGAYTVDISNHVAMGAIDSD